MNVQGPRDTPAVHLEALRPEELDRLYAWFLESNPERLTCRPVEHRTSEDLQRRFRERERDKTSRTFAIRLNANNELVGRVAYFDLNTRNRAAEIGVLISPGYRRRGIARQAVLLLLGHLFQEVGMNKVMAQTGSFNKAAISLLTALGFTQDGRLRQHHLIDGRYYDDLLFSLLAEEFRTNRSHGATSERKQGEDGR